MSGHHPWSDITLRGSLTRTHRVAVPPALRGSRVGDVRSFFEMVEKKYGVTDLDDWYVETSPSGVTCVSRVVVDPL